MEELRQEIKDKLLGIIILVIGAVGTDNDDIRSFIDNTVDEILASNQF